MHLLTNDFEQSSICFRQSEVIETNGTSMKQFRFYCDKLHCIRSDIVQTVVKFVSVKYSLFQMKYECFKQIKDCSIPFVKSRSSPQQLGRNGEARVVTNFCSHNY